MEEETEEKYNIQDINVEILQKIYEYIKGSPELIKLFKCTQMVNSAVREEDPIRTTRGEHTIQVAKSAKRMAIEYSGEKKTIKRAYIVGLAHDLGHTPMGHATEMVLTNEYRQEKIFENIKNPNFNHAQMSGPVLANIFERMFEENYDNELEIEMFSKNEITAIKGSNLIDYLVEGVQNHSVYLVSELNGNAKNDVALICGRLADTISYMPTDLYDLLHTVRNDGEYKDKGQTIINETDLNDLAYNGMIREKLNSNENKQRIQINKTFGNFIISKMGEKEGKEFIQNIIDKLLAENQEGIYELQATMATEAIQYSKARGVLPETISDDLKLLRDAEFNSRGKTDKWDNIQAIPWGITEFVKRHPKSFGIRVDITELDKEEQNNILENVLKGKNFIDNFEINGKITSFQNILQNKTNQLRENCPTLSFIYELQDELSYNQALQAQRETDVLGNDEKINNDIISSQYGQYKQEYEQGISETENNNFEIMYNKMITYMSPFKDVYQSKTLSTEEISELKKVAYATYKVQKLTNDDVDQIRETQALLNTIENREFVLVSEMHDQKSDQHFEDIESGKYNVPPPYLENSTNLPNNQNGAGDGRKSDSNPIEEKSLIEIPSGLKAYISNFLNKVKYFDLLKKVKESNLFKKITNKSKNNETQNKNVDIATEKMEAMKKDFDSRISVSVEEQEKNRIEYELYKQRTATLSVSRGEQEGQEHE